MGNHKFRLTDIIPNAWLYKLMCMRHKGSKNQSMPRSKRRSLQSSPRHSPSPNASKLLPNRASYYISSRAEASDAQLLLDPPRRSKRRSRVKPITRASATGAAAAGGCGCGCRSWNIEPIPEFSPPASPESPTGQRDYYIDGAAPPELHKLNTSRGVDGDALTSCSHPCSCKITSSPTDIIIDVNTRKLPKKLEEVTMPASEIRLPPILTKPAKKETETAKFENDNKSQIINATPVKARSKIQERRSSSSPPGLHRLRLRTSPRLMSKKALQRPRRGRKSAASAPPPAAAAAMQRGNGFSESFAVVKSSSDPQRDFRDSMLEMIVENDMRTSKDLEDLLTCYLLLNSREYHGIIVEVFKQIWFDLTNIKL